MTTPNAGLNRAAIVTGAGRGIGRVIALRLAQDGYDVAINDLASSAEALNAVAEDIRAKGRKAIVVTGDVSNEQDVQNIVDRTVEELGLLYVMVANAGIGLPLTLVTETSLDIWNRFMAINLTGVFLCYRAAARQMLKQGSGGRIIGASSSAGKRGGPEMGPYSAAKFGVRGLTQSLASELAKENITVNAYGPGYIDTPLTHNVDKEYIASTGKVLTELWKAATPMGRGGTPEDIAGLVSYIVSQEANFMTGQTVSINGGLFYD